MILAFSTHWPSHQPNAGQPTHFVEKIWGSITDDYQSSPEAFLEFYNQNHEQIDAYNMAVVETVRPKLHTIRLDQYNRWAKGKKIHFTINCRMPNQWQFAPVVRVTRVQKIEIKHRDPNGCKLANPTVHIDGVWLTDPTELALNDGFASLDAFFSWFNTDFTGKLIHWTNHCYRTAPTKAIRALEVITEEYN